MNNNAVRLSFLRPPPCPPVDNAPPAPGGPPQVGRAALPPVLVDNRPPVRPDASLPSFHDGIPQLQIADPKPIRVVLTPPPHIADSQPPPVAPSPPQFNGPPPVHNPSPQLMSIRLPNLSKTINSQLIDKSSAPPSNCRHKRNVNPPRRLEDYYLGSVGENVKEVVLNSIYFTNDYITIKYAYHDYNSTVSSSSTNFVYSTTCFNDTVDVNLNSINFSTEFNLSSPILSSSLILSQFYPQLNINFNSPYNFQSISSYSIDDMQHDDEAYIFSDFANRLISLLVAHARLNAAPTFDVLI